MNIPDEAVEAALKGAYPLILDNLSLPFGASVIDYPNLEDLQDADRTAEEANNEVLRAILRAALEAAAPHMLTRVTNAVINRAYQDGRASALAHLADAYDEGLKAGNGLRPRGNPYI